MIIKTNAIVLKIIPYSDTSVIAKLFTEEHGKISIIAKGAWKPKKSFGNMLDPMKHISIQYYYKDSRSIQILKDISLIKQFSIIRAKLKKIILGQAIIEILDKSTIESAPMPILYRLCWRVLYKMNDSDINCKILFLFFLYQITVQLGFMPNVDTCSKCNKNLEGAFINLVVGELVCLECKEQSTIYINQEGLGVLKLLKSLHLDNIHYLKISTINLYSTIMFLNNYCMFHIEGLKHINSFNIIQKTNIFS